MHLSWVTVTSPEQAAVAAAVVARLTAAMAVGVMPIAASTSLPVKAACVLGLAVAAWPAASAAAVSADPSMVVGVIVGEATIGLGLGLAVAAVLASAAWAGTLLGSVSGLSWADDFAPEPEAQAAGISRLAWWLGLMGFLAAGGHVALVAGLIDTFRVLPVGAVTAAGGRLTDLLPLVTEGPATGLALALLLAGPALAAVLAFHAAAAIAVRVGCIDPGQGLLQSLASLVLVAAVCLAADSWIGGYSVVVGPPIERCFEMARP